MKKLIADVNVGDKIRTYHGPYGHKDWLVTRIVWDSALPFVVVNDTIHFDKTDWVTVVENNHV